VFRNIPSHEPLPVIFLLGPGRFNPYTPSRSSGLGAVRDTIPPGTEAARRLRVRQPYALTPYNSRSAVFLEIKSFS